MSMPAYQTSEARRTPRASHLGGFKFLSVGRSHAGVVRAHNEDACLCRPDVGLWAVADGMGGHKAGYVASRRIVETLSSIAAFSSAYAVRDAVARALAELNDEFRAEAGPSAVMGATVAVLMAHQGHYACAWAGDSRIYLYRRGQLRRLTHDHTVVQEMVDSGMLGAAQARAHPQGHVLTKAVGAGPELELSFVYGALAPEDQFLLCSDGLSNIVEEREMAEVLRRPPLEAAADRLLERALSRDAPDNVTVVLVAAERALTRRS